MTVRELIEALEHFPPEKEVVIESSDSPRRAMAVRSASLDLMDKASRHLCSDASANATEYVDVVSVYWSWHPDDDATTAAWSTS